MLLSLDCSVTACSAQSTQQCHSLSSRQGSPIIHGPIPRNTVVCNRLAIGRNIDRICYKQTQAVYTVWARPTPLGWNVSVTAYCWSCKFDIARTSSSSCYCRWMPAVEAERLSLSLSLCNNLDRKQHRQQQQQQQQHAAIAAVIERCMPVHRCWVNNIAFSCVVSHRTAPSGYVNTAHQRHVITVLHPSTGSLCHTAGSLCRCQSVNLHLSCYRWMQADSLNADSHVYAAACSTRRPRPTPRHCCQTHTAIAYTASTCVVDDFNTTHQNNSDTAVHVYYAALKIWMSLTSD